MNSVEFQHKDSEVRKALLGESILEGFRSKEYPEPPEDEAQHIEPASWAESMGKMKTIHKVAAGLFLMGKMGSIFTGGLVFVGGNIFTVSLIITCLLIGSCVALCLFEMLRNHLNVDTKIERLEKELDELRRLRDIGFDVEDIY